MGELALGSKAPGIGKPRVAMVGADQKTIQRDIGDAYAWTD